MNTIITKYSLTKNQETVKNIQDILNTGISADLQLKQIITLLEEYIVA